MIATVPLLLLSPFLQSVFGIPTVVAFPGDVYVLFSLATEKSSVNEAMITGESKPVTKTQGGKVIGGSVNAEGALTVEVKKVGRESYLSQMINLVREAQESRSKTQNLADRAAFWLTVVALTTGVLTFMLWFAAVGSDFAFSLERAILMSLSTVIVAINARLMKVETS